MQKEEATKRMKKPRKKLRRVLLIMGAIFVVSYIFLSWLGRAPRTPSENVILSFHAGCFKHTVNQTSGMSKNSIGNIKAVRCRTAHVYSPNNSPLMIMVGKAVAKNLQALPWTEDVTLFHAGEGPEPGNAAPDLTFSLDVKKLDKSGIVSSKLGGTFVLMGGNSPIKKLHTINDFWTPVGTEITITINADMQCRFIGIATESGFYGQVADAIAKNLVQSIDSNITKELDKGQPFSELPENFYPAYQKPIELPECLKKFSPKIILSEHGLMESCRTFWRFQSDTPHEEITDSIEKTMNGTGWSMPAKHWVSPLCSFRMKKGEDVLEFFQGYHPEEPIGAIEIVCQKENAEPESKKPPKYTYYIEYRDRMSRAEIENAIDTILNPETPVETLLLFSSKVNDRQRAKLIELLENATPLNRCSWFQLASFYGSENKSKAKHALYRAWVLNEASGGISVNIDSEIEELAKKLGMEKTYSSQRHLAQKDVPLLEELGFVQFPGKPPLKKIDIAPDKQVRLFSLYKESKIHLFIVEMVPDASSPLGYQLKYFDAYGNSHCWGGSGTSGCIDSKFGEVRYRFTFKKSDPSNEKSKYYLEVTTQ